MRRNWIPKKVLAAILAVSLLTPSFTVHANPVESTETSEAVETTDATEVLEDAEVEAESEAAETEEEEAPLFEKVDPQEEGLIDPLTTEEGNHVETEVDTPNPEDETRVIIVMDGDSVIDKGFDTEDLADNKAAMKASKSITVAQDKEIQKISDEALDGEELDVNYSFSILMNAVSADVAFKDIEEIEKVDGVAAVYVAAKHEPLVTAEPQTITAGEMIGSYNTWNTGYTGAGMRIAVIDTGVDMDHPSFDGGAFETHLEETAEASGKTVEDYDLLDKSEIESVVSNLNAFKENEAVTADKLYYNQKVPFAFNYVDRNFEVTHDNDDQGDHGTHVSGIATANKYVPNAASETGYSEQASGVVGVAPDAQLITMKVFGAKGGAYTDDYMAAIEDAILLKADAINLSLGSSAAGYSSDSEEYINEIFKKLEGTSTVVSISAGNSGRWADETIYGVNFSKDVNQDTVGSPGSYTNALTVASAVNSGITTNYVQLDDGQKVFYSNGSESKAPHFTTLDTSADKSGTSYPFVYLKSKGEAADFENIDVKDKIVFVQRGAITFAQKQENAEAAGAKAVIVYNNAPGTITMNLETSKAVIPAASITAADGEVAAASGKENADGIIEGTITVMYNPATQMDVADGYTMSTFSSYGVPSSLDLKPEITAPGGNIYSTRGNGTYGLDSGTSMAAPSIAGQTALVQQYIKENNLDEKTGLSIRTLAQSLIMSTASPLYEGNDKNGLEYSPRSQGAGLANVYDAVSSPAYVLVGDKEGNDGKVKVTLGDDPTKSGSYNFSFNVYNMDEKTHYYVLDSSVLTEQLFEEDGVSYFKGASHKLNPAVTLTADDTTLVYDLNNDGTVNYKDRKVLLQVVNGSKKVDIVDENEDYFDFNKDGVVNTKDVYAFSKQLKGGEAVADLGLKVMEVKDSTKVDVSITLSDSDKAYLSGFENGMYVDGFIYVKGAVNLSVPFLAFYGSWMDSPMFEEFDFQQYVHDQEYAKTAATYVGVPETNYLSFYPNGMPMEDYYVPNYLVHDEKYIEDRNAISSENGTKLGSQYFTLMRNASRLVMTIKDKNTNQIYFQEVQKENYAPFYVASEGRWYNTVDDFKLNWAGTDADGKPLADGTQIELCLQAIPSYYNDVEDVTTLTAPGMFLKTSMTIDNTEPVVTDITKGEDGKYNLTLYDNRYVASVVVVSKDKKTILAKYGLNQETPDQDVTLSIDAPEDVVYVEVYDYALNYTTYRINNTGHADTKYVSELSVDKDEVELVEGEKTQVKATVGPNWLIENYDRVQWSSDDESVAKVSASGVITAKKAGETTVKVTTVATDKKGKHLTATIKVKVVEKKAEEKPEDEKVEDDKTDDAKAEDQAEEDKTETEEKTETENKTEEPQTQEENTATDNSSEADDEQLGGENDD